MMRIVRFAFMLALAARSASAQEIKVMTSGAFTAALTDLTPVFEGGTGHKLTTVYGGSMGSAPDTIPNRLQRGEPADVVIMASTALDDLIAKGLVAAGSRVDLVRSTIGMAVRAGAPKPDIRSVDALRQTLLSAKSIAYSSSASGTYLSSELFPKLGIADRIAAKSKRIDSETVGAVVARGDAEIGFQQMSELRPVKGIDIVGPLPGDAQRVTIFSAGIAAASKQPAAARRLIAFLSSPAAAPAITKSGLEPVTAVAKPDRDRFGGAMRFGTSSLLFWASNALAQQPAAQPPRDAQNRPPVMPAGTATIKGRVVDAQTGVALPRARVRLNWSGPGGSSRPPVTTDQSGAFAFSTLPAGSFTLMAEKSTYVSARFPETGETLRAATRNLTLTDGQILDTVVIRLYHGGVIAGRVVDTYGDAVEFAQVQALKLPKSGRGVPQQRNGGQTNDLGEFRLARLEPGKYLVMVMPQRRDVIEQPGTTFTTTPEPQPLPTFYPAAMSIDDAQPISVERGTTTASVEIVLAEGSPVTVTGFVVDASGQPVTRAGTLSVRPVLKDLPQNGVGTTGGGLKPDGSFSLRLVPGEYQIEARQNPPGMNGPPAPGTSQVGMVRMSVSVDTAGVTIQLGPAAQVTGRFVFDGSTKPPTPPTSPNGPPMFTSNDGSCRNGNNRIAADWTFTADDVFGTCVARFNGGYPQWFFKAVLYDNKDLTDQRITFTPGLRMKDVVVLFTDKRTEMNLHVVDDRGAPTRDYVALAFSTDKAKWSDPNGGFGGGSRYVRTFVLSPQQTSPAAAAVSQPGLAPGQASGTRQREMIAGLPAGEYYVIAVDDLDSEGPRDPDVLEQLAQGATRVTIADGEPAEVNLRVVKLTR